MPLQRRREAVGRVVLERLFEPAIDMPETLLLLHIAQLDRVVALPLVAGHHPGVGRGNPLAHLLVPVLTPDLVDDRGGGIEDHQEGRIPVILPARIIGVNVRRLLHPLPERDVRLPYRAFGLPHGVLTEGALGDFDAAQRSKHLGHLPLGDPEAII